mmetsp:Transcript_12527/g.43499  ORF Transcript_12527/g.43499 Transcript_12527/m.43499 type:complete len:370 (+) Transcript_12527:970-2079(+)
MEASLSETVSPMQSSTFSTGQLSSSVRRAATGVRRNLSSGPDLGRPRWDDSITLAPFLVRYSMVGTAARMRVSSVMFRSASRGTLRSARSNTTLPLSSASERSPTDFLAACTLRAVRRATRARRMERAGTEVRMAAAIFAAVRVLVYEGSAGVAAGRGSFGAVRAGLSGRWAAAERGGRRLGRAGGSCSPAGAMSTNTSERVGDAGASGKGGGAGCAGADSHAVAKRLQQELMSLMMNATAGISAFPDGDNIFQWVGTIHGGDGTVYEGLKYKLSLQFPSDYPFKPPTVKFETPCFHPNVDQYGNICLDILKEKWSSVCDVRTVLISIQSLLGDPNNDSPLNGQAAMLWANQEEYARVLHKKYKEEARF